MKNAKQARLQAHGWRVGSAADFLELSDEEAALIETKLALSRSLRHLRTARRVTQVSLARRLKSSQSRVAKMETGDPSVSVDLLPRALYALGASHRDVAKALRSSGGAAA